MDTGYSHIATATVTVLDMLLDAYEGGKRPLTDPPKSSLSKRVLYSAVQRLVTPKEFEGILDAMIDDKAARVIDGGGKIIMTESYFSFKAKQRS